MKPGIYLKRIWSDVGFFEVNIEVSDGTSMFSNRVYVGNDRFAEVIPYLEAFSKAIHGGILDIELGKFGPEYASGAFHARLHFAQPGKLYITCRLQSEFKKFSKDEVASEATLYLRSEPALLDNFIAELKSLNANIRDDANLEGI
jgi:hypothetical protein